MVASISLLAISSTPICLAWNSVDCCSKRFIVVFAGFAFKDAQRYNKGGKFSSPRAGRANPVEIFDNHLFTQRCKGGKGAKA
jgi:hypothetical protein